MLKRLLLLFFLVGLSLGTSRLEAACWCKDPIKYNCGCASNGSEYKEPVKSSSAGDCITKGFDPGFCDGQTFSTEYQGIPLECNTQDEVNSLFAKISPICVSSQGPEIMPGCARNLDDPSDLICYGTGFALGESNVPLSTGAGRVEVSRIGISNSTVRFNGRDYPNVVHVQTCEANNFCCSRSTQDDPTKPNYFRGCSNDGVAKFNNATNVCNPPRTNQTAVPPPENICGYNSPQKGESRLFIPHLRNISALATLLQTIYNPFPSLFANNALPAKEAVTSGLGNQPAVVSQIDYHQGEDDITPTVSEENDNSSLVVGKQAPAPLYSFGSYSQPYNGSGMCTITETRVNEGDDLLGPEVTATFTYTQKYEYPVAPKPANCRLDDSEITEADRRAGAKCCSEFEGNGYEAMAVEPLTRPGGVVYKCATRAGQDFPTQGQVAVFTKTPLIEYIYEVLVVGPQSVFKRIMPEKIPEEIKEIPSKAGFAAAASTVGGGSVQMTAGTGTEPTIYFPHVGSLYEYFLQGVQKALRPSAGVTSRDLVQSQQKIEGSLAEIAAKYGVPENFLDAIWYIETGRNPGSSSCKCENDKACGPMQIGGVAYRQVLKPGENLDRCQLPDAFELAARILLHKKYCTTQECNYDRDNPVAQGGVDSDELDIAARYNGSDGCFANNETQCRWGPGYTYCDAVNAISNGIDLPTSNTSTTELFCKALNLSDPAINTNVTPTDSTSEGGGNPRR